MPLTAGTMLGQYEIRSPLGAGGMGEVYRAHDARLNRDVAIKVLPESLTLDSDRWRRFEQEARAAAALNHPNILAVYQMATHESVSYMVTELLEGETLRERLMRGPIPLRRAIDYAVQIAHGLAAAHDKGIVHRDLKPENLFVTKDGRVKILDFGLAKVTLAPVASADGRTVTIEQQTEPGLVMGTVGYMSPEQVRGQDADTRSDIFAFGAVLYEMVTGKPPFRRPTKADTVSAILNEDPQPISQLTPTVPPGLQRVVHRCLEKNPEQRFHSAHDLAFALEALTDSAISSSSESGKQQSAKPTSRRPVIAAAVIALMLAAVALTYWWTRPEAVPKVSNYVQITHDGENKSLIGSDGPRIYLNFWTWPLRIAAVPFTGGAPTRIPLPFANVIGLGLSPDGSELLAVVPRKDTFELGTWLLWSVPALGGSPHRMGDATSNGAGWSPDGKRVAYCAKGDLFVAKADGSDPRKLVSMQGSVLGNPVWSPDGSRVRFSAKADSSPDSLWEVSSDGNDLHQLLPGWGNEAEFVGGWTASGKYFLFESRGQIWALPRKGRLLGREPTPIQLTFSPMVLDGPVPSRDGKKIFVIGRTPRAEAVRYDWKSGQYSPFLGGGSAEYFSFSKDGQWVAYVSYPEGTLWRSKVDGSERMQLTYPPGYVINPRWSPDGKTIVFSPESTPGNPAKMYEVSRDGGTPKPLLPDDPLSQVDPNWSPQGRKIVFGGDSINAPDRGVTSAIRVLDLDSHQVTTLPGSEKLFAPRWSPDGRYIVAQSTDATTLQRFDLQTQKWMELVRGKRVGWANWSKDGRSLYVIAGADIGVAVLRIQVAGGQVERVSDLKNFAGTGHWDVVSLSLAPDDSGLLLRDASTSDVYALDWEEP